MELDKEQIVDWILTNQYKRFNKQHYSIGDINVDETMRRGSRDEYSSGRKSIGNDKRQSSSRSDRRGASRDDRRSGGDASKRLFINLGKKDNIRYDEMRELIYKHSKVSGFKIKDIEMKGVYSFFQTDEKSANQILDSFRQVNAYGREVRIQEADKQKLQ
jgi:DbpA RNA binding domain.